MAGGAAAAGTVLEVVVDAHPEVAGALALVSRTTRKQFLRQAALLSDRCRVCRTCKACDCWQSARVEAAPSRSLYGVEVALLGPLAAEVWSRGRIVRGVYLAPQQRIAWELTLVLVLRLPLLAPYVRYCLFAGCVVPPSGAAATAAARLFTATVPVFTKHRAELFLRRSPPDAKAAVRAALRRQARRHGRLWIAKMSPGE